MRIAMTISLWALSLLLWGQWQNSSSVQLTLPYAEQNSFTKYLYDSAFYEESRVQNQFDYLRFTYPVGEYQVEGFACLPGHLEEGKKYPVIIYNRGGTGNYGKLSDEIFPYFYRWAKEGFIIVGSNYRFVNDLGPYDQLGGEELNDIITLHTQLTELPYCDEANMFMIGVSRGGLMTYQAISKIKINSAAVIGGVSNVFSHFKQRPLFLEGWTDLSDDQNYKGLSALLSDFEARKEEYLTQRSPTKWADKITSPVYILHSRQDGFVSVNQALDMSNALQAQSKSYQLKIYDEKSHSLPDQYFDSFDEILSWFNKHMNK